MMFDGDSVEFVFYFFGVKLVFSCFGPMRIVEIQQGISTNE